MATKNPSNGSRGAQYPALLKRYKKRASATSLLRKSAFPLSKPPIQCSSQATGFFRRPAEHLFLLPPPVALLYEVRSGLSMVFSGFFSGTVSCSSTNSPAKRGELKEGGQVADAPKPLWRRCAVRPYMASAHERWSITFGFNGPTSAFRPHSGGRM